MTNRFSRRAKIGAAVAAILLATAAYDTRWGPPACDSAAWSFPIKPKMVLGLSIGFGPWAKAAFPVGSCEADLIAWMDRLGFEEESAASSLKFFENVSEADLKFALEMESKKILMISRVFRQPAILRNSIFEVGWFADENNRLKAIYARSNLFHFEWL